MSRPSHESIDQSSGLARARRAAWIWGLLLVTLTSWPKPPRIPIVSGIPHFDKLVHFSLYAVEAFLIYRAVRWPGRPRFSLGRALAIVGAMAVWGVADETHQSWIPGRSMEGGDVAADVSGAALGALAASGRRMKSSDLSSRGRRRAIAALATGTSGSDEGSALVKFRDPSRRSG